MRDLKNMAAQRKPNLVLFLPDQQRADTIACYGGAKVHAPNLNKLASESVVFERTYVTHPVCTPSRSSLMTGTWPHTNGAGFTFNVSLMNGLPPGKSRQTVPFGQQSQPAGEKSMVNNP